MITEPTTTHTPWTAHLDAMDTAIAANNASAAVAGRALGTLKLQERAGVIVFAMRAGTDRAHLFNPPPDRMLQVGDVLIACADHDQLEAMRKIAAEG